MIVLTDAQSTIVINFSQIKIMNPYFHQDLAQNSTKISQPLSQYAPKYQIPLAFSRLSPQSCNVSRISKQDLAKLNKKELDQRQFSIRSISTTKSPRVSLRNYISERQYESNFPTISEEMKLSYNNIERILKNENDNLKGQNELLLREIYKLKRSNHTYKQEYNNTKLEIEAVRMECEAQKMRADEMKDIIMNRLVYLEGKVTHGPDSSGNLAASECNSLLEALSLSESGIK